MNYWSQFRPLIYGAIDDAHEIRSQEEREWLAGSSSCVYTGLLTWLLALYSTCTGLTLHDVLVSFPPASLLVLSHLIPPPSVSSDSLVSSSFLVSSSCQRQDRP